MNITRRQLISGISVGCCVLLATDAFIEPYMIEETFLDKSELCLDMRVVHFSDFHFKGNMEYGRKVVEVINSKKPDLVFFTGDLVESGSSRYLQQALELLEKIRSPCYSVLGNHDSADSKSVEQYEKALGSNGGKLLQNERLDMGSFVLHGIDTASPMQEKEDKKKLLLCHYPIVGNCKMEQNYDLILCGHSHGGQVRLPFLGALIVPFGVGRYVSGYYEAKAGSMYVNRGVGEFLIPVRMFCMPEITEIKL